MRPRDVMAGAFAVVSLLVSSAASPAQAQEEVPRALAVRAGEDQRPWAEALRRAAIDEFRAHGVEVVEPPTPPPPRALGGALDDAATAYAHLRPAEALRLVDGVLAGFESTGAGLDREGYLRALLLRALSALALGLDAEAEQALSSALAVDPALAPAPAEYPPSLLERLEAMRARSAAPAGVLLLDVDPPSAELWLDGARLEPSAPRRRLPPGRHVLRFDAPLRAEQVRVVEIAADAEAPLFVQLVPSGHEALGRLVPEDAPEALLAEAAHGLGAALVSIEVRAAPGGRVVHARDTGRRRAARVSARADEPPEAVARRLVGLLLAPTGASEEGDARRRRRIRIGASVGAAAVAAGVAATLVGVFAGGGGARGFEGQWSRDVP